MRIIRGLILVLVSVALGVLVFFSLPNSKSEKFEDCQQVLLRIANDYRFAKLAGEAALKNAGQYAEAGSPSYWLYVAMACGNDPSEYDGVTPYDRAALSRMSKLAAGFADELKADELFGLASSGHSHDALQTALMLSGVPGQRDWKTMVILLERRLEINAVNLSISDGKAIEKMIANIQAFIKERDRLFAKSSH